MKQEYSRKKFNEAPWIKEEEARLMEKYMNEAPEDMDLGDFVRENASPEYLRELETAVAM